ncbi:MAG: response regulator [Deltaproteobacteria bacterium]|nr:response regulator [Deltaproteobacteria bacterium]
MTQASPTHEASRPKSRDVRRGRIWTIALIIVAIAAGELLMWLGGDADVTPWWVAVVYPAFFLVASFRCFRTARRLKADDRKAWLYFGFGSLSFSFAELIWGTYNSLLGISLPSPSIADIGYFAAPTFFGIGVWHWRARTPTAWLSRVQLGNLGIIFSSILLAYLFLFYGFMRAPIPTLTALVGLSYGILDVSVAFFAVVVVYLHLWSRRRLTTMLILFALIASAGSDAYYSYSLVTDGYDLTGPMNILYLLVASFVIWAAFEQDQLGEGSEYRKLRPDVEDRAKQWETLLPAFAVAAVLVVAFVFRAGMHAKMLPYIAAVSAVFVISLAVRNWSGHRMETQLRMQAMASEAKLQRSNRELRDEMQMRAQIEEELRQSQKMQALGHLTGGVAHDFNNLLAVILGNLELAERSDATQPAVRELLGEAIDAASRGATLTQRLLTLSRKQELRPESIDVFALLDDMRSLLERSLGEQVEVELGEKHAGLYCLADRSQLEGAILNLAINARDAMSDGGTLSIDAAWAPVDEAHAAEYAELLGDGCVAISVRDTGVGIPQNVLDRVFEPFFTTKDIGEGTGLGLSMVYGFAKQSGGHVEIDSADGAGTEVKLYLPRSEALPRVREGGEDTGSHRGDGESVLVLEDEPALRRLVATHLENLGYAVVSVANGEEALSEIESMESIDLLLSDVMLPGGLSGREVATEMNRRRPEVKILLMSGYAKEILTDEDPLGSGDALLNKPFQLTELARKVREMLDA